MEIYLVYVDAIQNSNKFWAAIVEDNNLIVEWGRVGYKSQTKTHSLRSNQEAVFKYRNLVAKKMMKGYRISQSQINSNCEVSEINRAIELRKDSGQEVLTNVTSEAEYHNYGKRPASEIRA
jgi:predicted DNA-binding WGR domain protein